VTTEPEHPIAQVIEQFYQAEQCPRVVVNSELAGTIVPEHVRAQFGQSLPIDLDPAYPLDLVYEKEGIRVSLAFSGTVMRCFLPWEAIYIIVDRATRRGALISNHVPEELRKLWQIPLPTPTAPPPKEPEEAPAEPPTKRFRVIPGGRS
jgi:stringent starvation protein B